MSAAQTQDSRTSSAAGEGIPPPPKSGPMKWLPGLWVARHYRRAWLVKDLAAGLVLTSLLVPAGMGYAAAAGLPPICGLYATIFPLIAYAIFGPSRIMVLGPDSGLAALIAAAVLTLSAGDVERAVGLGSVLAILTGVLCIAAGLLRAGFVTDLLSKPVRVGYLNGIGLTVLVTQLPKLFGFSVTSTAVVDGVGGLVRGLADGRLNPVALGIGSACLCVIFVTQRFAPRFPGILFAVRHSTAGAPEAFDGGPGWVAIEESTTTWPTRLSAMAALKAAATPAAP
jgi:MFS superfamily sulfate permease-like transporter